MEFNKMTYDDMNDDMKMMIEYIKCEMDDEDCSDNMRIMFEGDKNSKYRYKLQRDDGCCGFVDYRIYPFKIFYKGKYRRVLYGFNHGH